MASYLRSFHSPHHHVHRQEIDILKVLHPSHTDFQPIANDMDLVSPLSNRLWMSLRTPLSSSANRIVSPPCTGQNKSERAISGFTSPPRSGRYTSNRVPFPTALVTSRPPLWATMPNTVETPKTPTSSLFLRRKKRFEHPTLNVFGHPTARICD